MMFLCRRRARLVAALCMASCLAIDSCISTGQFTLARIGLSSFSLPLEQAIAGVASLLNIALANVVVNAVSGS